MAALNVIVFPAQKVVGPPAEIVATGPELTDATMVLELTVDCRHPFTSFNVQVIRSPFRIADVVKAELLVPALRPFTRH